MENTVKELTLLLLYLTSWQENTGLGSVQRSWKGYPFEVLDELSEDDYISGGHRAKSVYLSDKGIEKAKELAKKYVENVDKLL